MNFDRNPADASGRASLSTMPQQFEPRPMDRQQQQDNGTHEFQPRQQQGDAYSGVDDSQHTLEAYLKRAGARRELPSAAAGKTDAVEPKLRNGGH